MTGPVNAMMSDHEGNLWFNSNRQGVMKIVKNNFIDISNMAGLPELVVNSTCRSGDDLYIGTDVGLKILDKEYDPIDNDLINLLDGVRIRCITEDNQGFIWICTYSDHGLVRYDPKKGSIINFTTHNGLLSNRVRMIKQLSDGRMAVATNMGVNIIRDTTVTDSFDASSGISNLEILTIEEDEKGRLLLGSDGDGIYVVENGSAKRLGIDDGLAS
jgi:energy-coupling factor transport system substrate-specific component